MTRVRLVLLLLVLGLTTGLLPAYGAPDRPDSAPEVPILYQGQNSCDPGAKPGTKALEKLLRSKFGGGSSGISRACSVGGQSEHKEGRAFDWTLNANNPQDRARAKRAIKWLTETVNGVEAARAHELGIMYVIWDRKMWRGYDLQRGWDKYSGSSPHRDHMHISLTWSGAMKLTPWWRRTPVLDFGPCQKWVNSMAAPRKNVRLEPCPDPLRRPKANGRGIYRAQEGETVARVARWFDLDEARLRRWNSWPSAGRVELAPGQRIWVKKPPA